MIMKTKLWLFAVPALMAASAVTAIEIDFNSRTYFDTTVDGHDWLVSVDITQPPKAGYYDNSGYASIAGITGGSIFGSPAYEYDPLSFKYVGPGGFFTLDSFYFANAWGEQDVVITGYKQGEKVGSLSFSAGTQAQKFDAKGWGAIDEFKIDLVGSFNQASNVAGTGPAWALGSVNITAVPEPESYAMLLAGLAIVGAVARRRATSRV
jgi:hypothetical protein